MTCLGALKCYDSTSDLQVPPTPPFQLSVLPQGSLPSSPVNITAAPPYSTFAPHTAFAPQSLPVPTPTGYVNTATRPYQSPFGSPNQAPSLQPAPPPVFKLYSPTPSPEAPSQRDKSTAITPSPVQLTSTSQAPVSRLPSSTVTLALAVVLSKPTSTANPPSPSNLVPYSQPAPVTATSSPHPVQGQVHLPSLLPCAPTAGIDLLSQVFVLPDRFLKSCMHVLCVQGRMHAVTWHRHSLLNLCNHVHQPLQARRPR